MSLFTSCDDQQETADFQTDFSLTLEIKDIEPKSLALKNNGRLVFTKDDNSESIQLTEKQVEDLRNFLIEHNFFQLQNDPEQVPAILGNIDQIITAQSGEQENSYRCNPSFVTKLESGNEEDGNKIINCPESYYLIIEKIKSYWPKKIEYRGFS
jgi:hypothetical protein